MVGHLYLHCGFFINLGTILLFFLAIVLVAENYFLTSYKQSILAGGEEVLALFNYFHNF